MPQTIEIEVEGAKEAIEKLDDIAKNIERQVMIGLEKAMINTAEDIKVTFKGRPGAPGFHDKSGALRASIRGGVTDSLDEGDEVGFIGAGDETRDDEGKATKDYVAFIEFGEFSRAGNTSFLRAGVQKNLRQIQQIIVDNIDLERASGQLNQTPD